MKRIPIEWLTLLAVAVYWFLMRGEEFKVIDVVIVAVALLWSLLSLIKAIRKSKE